MLCRNCSYILSGKENFCPNCGTIPVNVSQAFPTIKKLSPEVSSPTEENPVTEASEKISAEKGVLFTENESDFPSPEEDETTASEYIPKDDKKSSGKVLFLLLLLCILATSAFALADYFDMIPDFSAIVSNFGLKDSTPQPSDFNHAKTVLAPETDYPMTTAYVFSGNGLTLRKGPGNGYAPLFNLTDLTKVQIFGGSLANTNWLYVYCGEKDCYGWLDGSYLCNEATAENELTSEYESEEDIPTAYYRNEDEYGEFT